MEANQTPSNKFNNLVSRALLAGLEVQFEAKILDGSEWFAAFITAPGATVGDCDYLFIAASRFTWNTKAKAFRMAGTRHYGMNVKQDLRPSDIASYLDMMIQQGL